MSFWLNKYSKLTFITILFLDILSALVFESNLLNSVCWFIVILASVVLSLCRLEYGLYLWLAELIVGSYGYSFSFTLGGGNLSLRMGLFLVIMGVWFYRSLIYIKEKGLLDFYNFGKKIITFPLIITFILITAWGIFRGLYLGNSLANIFFDGNAFVFWLMYFPLIWVGRDKDFWSKIFSIGLGALIYLVIKSFLLFFIFAHLGEDINRFFYTWVRDTRFGEVTLVKSNFYRVFAQSQIWLLAVFSGLSFWWFNFKRENKLTFREKFFFTNLLAGILSVIILSLSRSFWVGGLVSGMITFLIGLIYFKWMWLKIFFQENFFIFFLSVIFIIVIWFFPLGKPASSGLSVFSDRLNSGSEVAVSSRFSQLSPLFLEIKNHLFLGSGLGKEVTYKSSDPRVVKNSAGGTGIFKTFAFEWGYLDLWLKFGLFPFILLFLVISKIFLRIQKKWQKFFSFGDKILIISTALANLSVFATHFFSPYLNHPLGIGIILLSLVFGEVLLKKYDSVI